MKKMIVVFALALLMINLSFALHLGTERDFNKTINITQESKNVNRNTPTGYLARLVNVLDSRFEQYVFCQQCNFDGYVRLFDENVFNVRQRDFAMSTWVNTSAIDLNEGWIMSKGNPRTGNLYILYMATAGDVGFRFTDGSQTFTIESDSDNEDVLDQTSDPINDGVWHHLTATREGNVARLYIDGELQCVISTFAPCANETLVPPISVNVQAPLSLGANTVLLNRNRLLNQFEGVINKPRFWNFSISDTDATRLFNSGRDTG